MSGTVSEGDKKNKKRRACLRILTSHLGSPVPTYLGGASKCVQKNIISASIKVSSDLCNYLYPSYSDNICQSKMYVPNHNMTLLSVEITLLFLFCAVHNSACL